MNYSEINLNGKSIKLFGNKSTREQEISIITSLNLTGNEYEDRLTIQKAIDENNLKSEISYSGATVYSFEKIVEEYRKLQKSGSLDKLSNNMYHFFMYACGDIAHYNIYGYREYYDNSFRKLEENFLKGCWIPDRYTDIDRIFRELKIGRNYYYLRDEIDIDIIPISKLKAIIEECGWNVTEEKNYWKIEMETQYHNPFIFTVDTSSKSTVDIVEEITNYNNLFDKNRYVEEKVEKRIHEANPLSILEIVSESSNIKCMLFNLTKDLLYKSRIEAESQKYILKSQDEEISYGY